MTFNYVGYNESGRRIDSTYLQGAPARIRMGTNALVPGEATVTRDVLMLCAFLYNILYEASC